MRTQCLTFRGCNVVAISTLWRRTSEEKLVAWVWCTTCLCCTLCLRCAPSSQVEAVVLGGQGGSDWYSDSVLVQAVICWWLACGVGLQDLVEKAVVLGMTKGSVQYTTECVEQQVMLVCGCTSCVRVCPCFQDLVEKAVVLGMATGQRGGGHEAAWRPGVGVTRACWRGRGGWGRR